jgi:hypothetical protein
MDFDYLVTLNERINSELNAPQPNYISAVELISEAKREIYHHLGQSLPRNKRKGIIVESTGLDSKDIGFLIGVIPQVINRKEYHTLRNNIDKLPLSIEFSQLEPASELEIRAG